MARNGSGVYTPPAASYPAVSGTLIESAKFNAVIDDVATALTESVAINGQTTMTGNLLMGSHKITGLTDGVAATDACAYGQAQSQSSNWCGTAGGTANALTLTPSPAITAYAAGQVFRFKSGASVNSGATTVAISGLATIAVQAGGVACVGREILASQWYEIVVDGSATSCQLHQISNALVVSAFAVHAAATPDMTVLIDAGKLQNDTTKVSIAQQITTAMTAPTVNPRKDLIVIDQTTAVYTIVTGAEAASPADPAIPSGKIAIARINWTIGMTGIPDTAIDDLRPAFVTPLTLTPASQAEMEAGTETALRSMSPLRISQACVKFSKLVQEVSTSTGAVATGTTVIPLDDTIPQNNEGNEYMTLAITPKNVANILDIEVVCILATTATGANAAIAALFQDTTAGAFAASIQYVPSANAPAAVIIKYRMVAGTTSATTFKVRAGFNVAGTTTFNGYASGRTFGGVMASSITIKESLP